MINEMLKKVMSKTKTILVWVSFVALIGGGLCILHTFLIYKALDVQRRKVIQEVYELYNKDSTDSMEQALLEVCVGNPKGLGSYARAEKGKGAR